tara:strand:+ start:718 stop:927 length:210 start_codon:yes stop_codon:yes gene_type:complete
MYEEQNSYEEALQLFGHRVGMLCAFEISHKLSTETCYKNIKMELKQLKKARKKWRKKRKNERQSESDTK